MEDVKGMNVSVDLLGNPVVVGEFEETVFCDEFEVSGFGGTDVFIGKIYDPEILVSTDETSIKEFIAYPNPFSTSLTFQMENAANGETWTIHSIQGQLITKGYIDSPILSVPTLNWAAGIYVLKVAGSYSIVIKK